MAKAAAAPRQAASGNAHSGRLLMKVRVRTAARLAPWLMPRMSGEASGLWMMPWMMVPERASAAPM